MLSWQITSISSGSSGAVPTAVSTVPTRSTPSTLPLMLTDTYFWLLIVSSYGVAFSSVTVKLSKYSPGLYAFMRASALSAFAMIAFPPSGCPIIFHSYFSSLWYVWSASAFPVSCATLVLTPSCTADASLITGAVLPSAALIVRSRVEIPVSSPSLTESLTLYLPTREQFASV